MSPSRPWPFDQPRNAACLTTSQVVVGTEPILRVFHDPEDHGWQFIGSSDASKSEARLLALEEIVEQDPTVLEVADLPPGGHAIRERAGGPWSRHGPPSVP